VGRVRSPPVRRLDPTCAGRRLAAVLTGCGAAVVAAACLSAVGSAAGAAPPGPGGAGPYYVAIGASESVGVQPVPWDHHGVPTDQGYTHDLTAIERARWPGLQLVDFGCPGITAQGALDGDGRCRYAAGSEVATAVRFIEAHPHKIAFVTVDLGFNDVWPCLVRHDVDEACVDAAVDRVARAVPAILSALRAAGGPDLLVVGLQHADPYVADARFGDVSFARETVPVFDRMNDVLSSAYDAAGAVLARVPDLRHGATGPAAVESACAQTWMCADRNIHPTADGYRVIAEAVATAISGAEVTSG
jgi:lysophospholipase L1-like esterase